jgi:hypothetical protein
MVGDQKTYCSGKKELSEKRFIMPNKTATSNITLGLR